jgi:hypothetical protein
MEMEWNAMVLLQWERILLNGEWMGTWQLETHQRWMKWDGYTA